MIEDKINRSYRCRICNEKHEIELSKNLVVNKKKFPFPHVFLHGELKEYLTVLYLDEDLDIRASEVQNLAQNYDNLFSKDQTKVIIANLMEEIENLRSGYNGMFQKDQIILIITNLMNEIENLRQENENLLKKLNLMK